jgi:hypothetical protein
MAKDEHLQEFIKLIKEELKKERPPKHPRLEKIIDEGRMPPSMVIQRLAHFNRKAKTEDTWLNMAVTAFEQWEKENYPETPIP